MAADRAPVWELITRVYYVASQNEAGDGDSTTYSGVLSDGSAAGGSLIKAGNGTLVLNGSVANTYTGTTAVQAGTLEIRQAGQLGAGVGVTMTTRVRITLPMVPKRPARRIDQTAPSRRRGTGFAGLLALPP